MVGDDDRIRPEIRCNPRVLGVVDAFQDQLSTPLIADPRDLGPVQLGVELFIGPTHQRGHILDALHMPRDVAERPALGAQHPERPTRLGHHVQDIRQRQTRRGGQAVFQILVALAQDLQIERQHKGGTACLARPFDGAVDEILVLHHI